MTGHFLLDFIPLAISLFNTLLLVWLGLTVLFNAERRTWGVFLAVGGLLAGAAFFISHSIILSNGAEALIRGFGFWWQAGWLPVIAAPCAWYLLMLWYTGFWDDRGSRLRRRHAPWLGATLLCTLLLAGLLLMGNPLPDISVDASLEIDRLPAIGGMPLLFLVYPPYILLCIGLALDALLRPAPSGRVMGDLARQRARPWLAGATLVLLLVSLLVGAVILWLVQAARQRPGIAGLVNALANPLAWVDLLLALLVMAAVLLLGQAVVSYEIFTGRTLPRRGFLKQWRTTVLLAAGLSGLAALNLTAPAPRIYGVLGILLLAALSYALFGWQSFTERERTMRQLRPFAASQRLFENILKPSGAAEAQVDLAAPFRALYRDLLGAREAALLPLGTLAALGVPPLRDPPGSILEPPTLPALLAGFTSPQMLGLPLEPGSGGAIWAVPLWSSSGLAGLLLLGQKSDGGFYSLEEIEVARASGERLADILASAEMARRLVALQRQRLVESGILDRRTRRVLHDEVLPRLHTALLGLSGLPQAQGPDGQEALELLAGVHRQISNLLRDLPAASGIALTRSSFQGALQEMLSGELAGLFDEADLEIGPEAAGALAALPPLVAEVLFFAAREAIRNAAYHARSQEDVPLVLSIRAAVGPGLRLWIEDNGMGFTAGNRANDSPPGTVKSAAPTGLPPDWTDPSGRGSGQGLALHSTLMAVVGGSLTIESAPGEYTRVLLALPGTPWQG